jgi:excisionase family DNA binding protein
LETSVLTLGEASKHLGVSKPTLSKAIKTGKLSATRREDSSWAIDGAELDRYWQANQHRMRQATLPTPLAETVDTQVAELRGKLAEMQERLSETRSDRDAWREQAQRLALTPPKPRRWWQRRPTG